MEVGYERPVNADEMTKRMLPVRRRPRTSHKGRAKESASARVRDIDAVVGFPGLLRSVRTAVVFHAAPICLLCTLTISSALVLVRKGGGRPGIAHVVVALGLASRTPMGMPLAKQVERSAAARSASDGSDGASQVPPKPIDPSRFSLPSISASRSSSIPAWSETPRMSACLRTTARSPGTTSSRRRTRFEGSKPK